MLEFHPLANLFPLIEGREFDDLVADIKANGLREKIVLHDGKIIDGRNRYRALIAADLIDADWSISPNGAIGWRFRYLESEHDPLAFVLSLNLHRRHLSESQRVMIAAEIAQMPQGRPSEWNSSDDKPANWRDLSSVKQSDAADMLNVSERSVQRGRQVLDHGSPELINAVKRDEMSVSAASEIAKLSVGEQLEILRSADPKAFAKVAKEKRAERQVEKKARRNERAADLAANHRALPDVECGLIYCDPAWKDEEVWSDETGMDRAADNHYPTMTLAEVMALEVGAMAAKDCILMMWCKTNNLVEAICVAAAWGFVAFKTDPETGFLVPDKAACRYVSEIAWDKELIGNGRWVRDRHEHLLIFRRGNPVCPAPGTQLSSVIAERKTEHSAKPELILDWIDEVWPDEIKIELNRRGPARPGWLAWGNEAGAADDVTSHQSRAKAGDDASTFGVPLARVEAEPASRLAAGRTADAGEGDVKSILPGSNPTPAALYRQLVAADALKGRHSRETAGPILRAAYACEPIIPIQQVADDLGHKKNTVLSWAHRLNLSDISRRNVNLMVGASSPHVEAAA